ncbi:restriction endonuclease subunit S [Chitinophaga solisilvae]|uniref:restriction endonuclease subunit S n=1 Tax=Chitinophaga solisilvae TaxID=1233460 RepID=UPI00136C7824|nr:restriction endonuclease subunit S [Chitinophaga solisilvae]
MGSQKIQLRFLFDIYAGSTPETGKGYYWDGDIPWITPEDISNINGYKIFDTKRKITDEGYESSGVKLAPKDSIVITKRAPIGNLAILGIDACCNQGCLLLVPQKELIPEYYYFYLLLNVPLLQSLGRGSTFMELSLDDLKSLHVPKVPIEIQRETVLNIQSEIGKIDKLLSLKEQQLVLLNEKRVSIIMENIK